MFAHEHLIFSPVFESGQLWHLRTGAGAPVVLKHLVGVPIEGFHAGWWPTFVYTGLGCIYLLGLENDGRQATWLVATDGRRLGDKLADLRPEDHARLHDAVLSLGPDVLTGNGMQFVEPRLLDEILNLAAASQALTAASLRAPASQGSLAMLGAPHRLRTHLLFRPGDRTLLLQEGWAPDEAGGSRGVGTRSTARAGIVPPASRHLLTLTLVPVQADRTELPSGIEIVVNDRVAAHVSLHPRWQSEGAELAFWLAPESVDNRPFEISFRHRQDFILAALKLEQGRWLPAETLDPAELMLRFENIGDNCEFGLVQRHFKADPVGLLRFAGLRDPRRLIRFLDDDFGQFGEPGSLGVSVIGGEYWIIDHVYGMTYHTFQYVGQVSAEAVIEENQIKARYLKRKFREDLEDARKILVYKRVVTQDLHEIIALHAALNRLGAVNKLLWVTPADDRHAPGDVEWVGDNLLRGYVGAISLSNAHDFDAETWLRLCRNALTAFTAAAAG